MGCMITIWVWYWLWHLLWDLIGHIMKWGCRLTKDLGIMNIIMHMSRRLTENLGIMDIIMRVLMIHLLDWLVIDLMLICSNHLKVMDLSVFFYDFSLKIGFLDAFNITL